MIDRMKSDYYNKNIKYETGFKREMRNRSEAENNSNSETGYKMKGDRK